MSEAGEKRGVDSRIKVPGFVKIPQNSCRFLKMGEPVEFRDGQTVAVPGVYHDYCYFIVMGQVIAGTPNSSEYRRIFLSFEERTLLLEQYLLTGKPVDLYYKAVRRTKARKISYHDLTYAMKSDFSVTLDVINAISSLGLLAHQRQRSESEDGARRKVCSQLLDLALVFGTEYGGGIMIGEKVTQEKIAALTGLHRITVTREIKKLKEEGILTPKEGFYIISSLEALAAYRDAQ